MKNQSTESTDGNWKSKFMINVQKISYLKRKKKSYSNDFENSVCENSFCNMQIKIDKGYYEYDSSELL